MTIRAEYRCQSCGHEFDRRAGQEEKDLRCPRCGGKRLEREPFLFGTSSADELSPADYAETLLAPCCGDAAPLKRCHIPLRELKSKQETEEQDKEE